MVGEVRLALSRVSSRSCSHLSFRALSTNVAVRYLCSSHSRSGALSVQLSHARRGTWHNPSTWTLRSSFEKLANIRRLAQVVSCGTASLSTGGDISYLSRETAEKVDGEVNLSGIALPQGLEIEAMGVASAMAKEYSCAEFQRVLIVSGPGNNGGDGLSIARHLFHWGYAVTVVYPKIDQIIERNELFARLVKHLRYLGIEPVKELPELKDFDVVVDSIFGFTFKGWYGDGRDTPFDAIVEALAKSPTPVVSVDVPSGWDTDAGPPESGPAIQPEMLVSLLAPKACAQQFHGKHHYLGGRFVAPSIIEKYKLCLPAYPGCEQCVKISPGDSESRQEQ